MSFIKFSKYQGLHLQDYGKTLIEDTSINSPDYFRITEFPNKLTSGRNAFLLAGNSEAFQPKTELKFECIGVDGRTVYMEVPSWIDGSGNRMISIWVYPWTPKGNGIITLVGKLRNGSIVRWKRLIKIDPFAANVTPLVFGKKPKVFVQEKQKEYLNLSYPIGTTAETQYTTGQISIEYNASSNETTATITGGTFTSDMEGGHLIIASPSYTFPSSGWGTYSVDPLTPSGQDNTNQGYDGYITAVINETTAKLNHPFELQNVSLDYSSWVNNYLNIADQTYAVYQIDVNPSNFTLDYIQTPVYTTGSGNVESYALVTISNLAPISGDADSVITYMRSAGFTEWEKIGDDSLNHKELLIDGESHELTKKMGFFVDQYTMNTYWSSSAHGYTPTGTYPSMSIASGSIMDALRISGSEQLSDNTPDRSAAYIRVNNKNPIEFYADNEYQISFRFQSYTDLFDGFPPELVVYMSGSAFDNVDINGAETDVTLGRKVASVGEENTFSTWQSQVTAIQTNPGFMPGVVGGGAYTNVAAMDAMMVANNPGGQAAAPYFSGQVANVSTAQQSNKSFWAVEGANIIPDPETQTYTFKADKDGTGVPVFQVKAGRWDISQISVKAIALPGFTPNHTFLLSHIPSEKKEDLLDFKWEFKDGQGVTNATYLVTHSMNFSGSNTFIEDALLPGTFNIGQSYAGTGFQFSGKNSAMIRTMGPDYPGFSQATGSGGGGIIMWSGSLAASGKEYEGSGSYYGVGMELVGSSSWLRFRTQTGSIGNDGGELDVRTNKFFLGSNSQYISGANGNIEISSSNFHLQNDGDIIMQGTITAEAGGTIGGFNITSHSLASTNGNLVLSGSGEITASAGIIGGWTIDGDEIRSPGMTGGTGAGIMLEGDSHPRIIAQENTSNYVWMNYTSNSNWGLSGKVGGNYVFTLGNPSGEGNSIAGWTFDTEKLTGGVLTLNKSGFISSSNWHISSSTSNADPVGFISSSAFKVSADGRITASEGQIAGATIGATSLAYSPFWKIQASTDTTEPGSFISSSLFKVRADGVVTASSILLAGGTLTNLPHWKIDNQTDASVAGFISSSAFKVSATGVMTASAGKIANWVIDDNTLSRLNATNKGIVLDADPSNQKIEIREDASSDYVRIYHTNNTDWGIIGRQGGNNIFRFGDTNRIAGWTFDDKKLSSFSTATQDKYGIRIDADTQLITIHGDSGEGKNNLGGNDADNVRVAVGQLTTDEFGIKGWDTSGNRIFELSSLRNEIAGWTFDNTKLTGANITISSSGEIKTSNFISSMVGGLAGAGYRIGADGIAEFEEARIRGTLSTAVFEKETVSAVGGALIVANATALKSGSLILASSLAGQTTPSSSFEVDAANGFAVGEFILAKATSSNGFVEEIMKIYSVDTSNNILHVSRSMRGNLINSMSSGQVLVSQGASGTGFILLNATSGSETPYIDIAERTGSGVNDLQIKSRLGDLSGISDSAFSDGITGFGLYTDNGYFKGKIEVAGGDLSTRPKSDYTIGLIATGSAGAPAYTSSIQYMYHTMGYTGGNAAGGQAGPNGTFFLFTSSSVSASDYYVNGNPLDLYVSAHSAWGVGSKAEAEQVLNLFDAGHSVLVMGNDTTTANATGSGETTWPIKKHGNYAGGGGQNTIQWMRGYVATGSGLSLSDPIISGLDTTAEWSNYTSTDGAGGAKILKRNPGGGSTVVPIAVSGSTQMDATTSELISGSGLVNAWYMTNPRGGRLVCLHQHDLEDVTSRAYGYGTTDTQQTRIMDFLLRRDLSQEQFHTGVTTITGNMVKTGKIESTNWASGEGSQIDLNGGTIKLGGSSDPPFAVNAVGAMTASAGTIGGYTIGANTLTTSNAGIGKTGQNQAFWAGSDTQNSAPFRVTHAGALVATSATITGDITVSNPGDFADVNSHMSGSQFYENFQATLDTKKWTTGNLGQTLKASGSIGGVPYSGSLFNNTSGNSWTAGAIGNTTFLRSQGPRMEVDLHTTATSPQIFFGFVPADRVQSDITTQYNYHHIMEGVSFMTGNVEIYSDHDNSGVGGGSDQGDMATSDFGTEDNIYRVVITLKPSGGARYELYKNGDYTVPHKVFDTTGNTREQLKPAFFIFNGANPGSQAVIGQLGVGVSLHATRISGNSVATGKIESSNWAASAGSQLDLNAGTIKLGGSSNPLFEVDTSGHVSASAGNIGGLQIGTTGLQLPDKFSISSSADTTDPVSFISSSGFKVSADGRMTASAGKIGGITIGTDSFGNDALHVGGNTWGDSGTAFIVNEYGTLSLKDKLKWDGTDLTISGDITVSNPQDFAQDTFYENFQTDVTSSVGKWLTYNIDQEIAGHTVDGAAYSGSRFTHAGSTGWTSALISATASFQRSQSPVMEIDLVANSGSSATAIGFCQSDIDEGDASTGTNIYHCVEAIYFYNNDIYVNHDDNNNDDDAFTQHNIKTSAWSTGDDTWFKTRITIKPDGGAKYEVYKNGDLRAPYAQYETSDNTHESLKICIFNHNNTQFFQLGALGVNTSVNTTRISGDSISTGNILSNNWGSSAGTNFNLNEGDLIIGGSTGQRFEFSGSANKMTFFSGSGAKAIEIDDTLVGDYAGIKITDGLLQVSNSVDMGNNDAAPLYSMNLNQTGGSSSNRKAAMFVITDNTEFDNGSITLTDFAPPVSCPHGGAGKTGTGNCFSYGVGAAVVAIAETNVGYGSPLAPRNAVAILASAKTGVDGSPQYSFYGKNGVIYNSSSIMCGYSSTAGIADNRSDTLFSAYGADSMADVDYYYLARTAGNQDVFYVDDSGILYASGEIRGASDVIAYYSSDERMKDNIITLGDSIDKIKQIRGVSFDWNENAPSWTKGWELMPDGKKHDIGVIAQEVEKVLPEAVLERENGYLAVDYEKIIPLLIEGIKEQQTTIEDLQTRIKKLEDK